MTDFGMAFELLLAAQSDANMAAQAMTCGASGKLRDAGCVKYVESVDALLAEANRLFTPEFIAQVCALLAESPRAKAGDAHG